MMNTMVNNKKVKTQYRWSLKRFSKNFLLLLLVSGIATILVSTAVKATFDNNSPQTIVIRVMRGDTLWSIAQKIEPTSDPRLVIYKIKERNQLVASNLKIGQSLEFQLQK
jgi:LysM repeat protein